MQRSRNLHISRNFNHPRVAIMEWIYMVISVRLNSKIYVVLNRIWLFINFLVIKSELQYPSLLNTNECNNDLVNLNVSLERDLPILYMQ